MSTEQAAPSQTPLQVGKESLDRLAPVPDGLRLEIQADSTTGYAAIQNNIPVVRTLTMTNTSAVPLGNFDVVVACSPAFAAPVRMHFECLAPGESRKIAPLDLKPNHVYLAQLDESERATISAKVLRDGEALAETAHHIDVLAYDQWAGTRSLPELLAAFCMPNSRVVDHLISKASTLLRNTDAALQMSGYQAKNREKVWKQISALYSTILAEDLHYSNPPASFGNDGQKIRTPERILDGRIGTCLDLTMLFASCLEQAGIHPIVLIKEGHSWVGAWLVDTCFPTALTDDVQAVRKRVKSGELIVFETTGVANAQKPSLRWACSTGEEYLQEGSPFLYAVDIRRAREVQIRPLPSRSAKPDQAVQIADVAVPAIEDMPALPPLDPLAVPAADVMTPDTPEGRLARWKSKLLDLTLRNKLLNFKPTKTSLRVICPDPNALEDALSEGKEFKIRPLPQLMSGPDTRDAEVFAARHGATPLDALAIDALGRREIIVEMPDDGLEGRLLDIFRAAGTGLEEGGANTLFLAFGFLQWQEDKDAEAQHLAPILLVPVTLSRQSVRSGFRLVRHDDDALVNPTLVQKLWQDFALKLPSFDVLPSDDKGIDVAKVLQTFRLQVAELKGWEVREQVHLGIFSFTKYLMWKDLQDRHQQLQANDVVSHLINNPGQALAGEDIGFEPATLDQTHRPQDLFAPLLSDSSQLRAICVASDGKNLVIEGPPGTGKSQTITNLISHLLATGKTVLFVSEKMAALEVVHRRLNSLGLGAFCLELHSSKARKAEVLKQLGTALDAASSRTVKEWELEAERLGALRQDLNGVATALHRSYPNDLTIFEAIGTCIQHGGRRPAPMSWADAILHTRKDLEALRETARQMAALASQLSDLRAHPLAVVRRGEWTPTWQQELLDSAQALASAAAALQSASADTVKLFGLEVSLFSLQDFESFDRLADILLGAPRVPVGLAGAAHDETARARLGILRQHGLARKAAWDSLGGAYREDAATLPAAELKLQWADAQSTWWPKTWFARRALTNRLRLFRSDQRRPDEGDVLAVLDALARVNTEDKALDAMAAEAGILLREHYASFRTDWDAVSEAATWAQAFAEAVVRMAGSDPDAASRLRDKLHPFVTENRAMLRGDAVLGASLVRYRDAYRDFQARWHAVAVLAQCESGLGFDAATPGVLARLLSLLQGWNLAQRQLQPWCMWQRSRSKAIAQGLQGLVTAVEGGDVPLGEVADYFEYSYRSWWVKKAIDREPALCTFSSADHERKIAEFQAADSRFQTLTQQYVAARLARQIPSMGLLVPGVESEMGKLRRELQKQRKHMPIRQLVQNLPTLLPRLKPCLLMSPLSVAQYLDAAHAQFDVVVFDEASQIPVWDAVGAIARGKQLICVGDPKQLPPTNFFNRVDDAVDGDDDTNIQDLESILDECLSIGMPKLGLNWHYRSKHESLITFSNVTYYENRLVTFPSPVTEDRGVRFEQVKGVYDRGGSRTNRAEADAIVKAIEMHYLDAARRNQTLGVVTFNQAQQRLIETLLDERRRISARLDQAIAQATNEPLFVKNLENVQGDERDVIYFSITYGPDAGGKLSLNFGPLNLEGGQRRLNVAVSRARQSIVIFSTLLPEHIDLSKVRAAGVRDLKHYLEFAIRGPRALAERSVPTGMEPDSPFEREVISALREKGWEVHPQVGVSGYRIDIGVVDPRAPGRYLLGVECDGRTYHSGATARDRDRLRQHVLESLGWKLHRIWSTDWWLNPEEPIRKLLARLEHLVAEAPTDKDASGENPGVSADETSAPPVQQMRPGAMVEVADEEHDAADALPRYRQAKLEKGRPELFYEQRADETLRHQLMQVINQEGPIADSLLWRRVARAWDLSRTGRRIEERLRLLAPSHLARLSGEITVYWPENLDPDAWDGFRLPGDDAESKRALDEIALEELGNVAVYALSQLGSTRITDLQRTVCKLLGVSRLTSDTEARLAKAFACGRAAKMLVFENDTSTLRRT
jgi:very-short-patch-repair endonuclease